MTPDDLEKRLVESHKLIYDLFKHLTTLSSGSVVLLAVMLDKAFPLPVYKWLVGAAVVCFMISVGCSAFMMFVTAVTTTPDQVADPQTWYGRMVTSAMLGSGGFFGTGVVILVIFVFMNI